MSNLHLSTQADPIIDLCDKLRGTLGDYLSGRTVGPGGDENRNLWLKQLKAEVNQRIHHDVEYNLKELQDYSQEVGLTSASQSQKTVIKDSFSRLNEVKEFIVSNNPSQSSQLEEQCWLAVQQFYADALDLAERLVDLESGRKKAAKPVFKKDGSLKRYDMMGVSSYRRLQTCLIAADVAVPNTFEMRFCRTMLPTVLHLIWHQIIPWGDLYWCDFEKTTLGWLHPDGLSRLRGKAGEVGTFHGREVLDDNSHLFDPDTRKTRHNVILVGAHRLGFLDFPFWTDMFRNTPHAVWANNAFYGAGMAKKLAKGRTTIPIRGTGKLPLKEALDQSISIIAEDKLPLFIIADGSQPNMMYGDQKRVKKGLRLLVDECIRQTASKGRKTYVLPITFDDPLGFLRGFDDQVKTTMHPPIEITEPSSDKPYTSVFDDTKINGGDEFTHPIGNSVRYPLYVGQARIGHPRRFGDC